MVRNYNCKLYFTMCFHVTLLCTSTLLHFAWCIFFFLLHNIYLTAVITLVIWCLTLERSQFNDLN